MKEKSKKEATNSWLIQTDPYDRNKHRRSKEKKGSAFNVHLCPKCSRVHEDIYFNGEGRRTVYHKGFPTYKLKRIDCVECECDG